MKTLIETPADLLSLAKLPHQKDSGQPYFSADDKVIIRSHKHGEIGIDMKSEDYLLSHILEGHELLAVLLKQVGVPVELDVKRTR